MGETALEAQARRNREARARLGLPMTEYRPPEPHPRCPTTGRLLPKPREHGTKTGYQQHWWRGETPCEPCRAASAAEALERYHAKRRAARGE